MLRIFSRTITTTFPRLSTANSNLSKAISSELEFEKKQIKFDSTPTFISKFISNSDFKIKDTPSTNYITFERHFGNEKYE